MHLCLLLSYIKKIIYQCVSCCIVVHKLSLAINITWLAHKTTSKHIRYGSCFVDFIPKNIMVQTDLKTDTQWVSNDHFKKIYHFSLLMSLRKEHPLTACILLRLTVASSKNGSRTILLWQLCFLWKLINIFCGNLSLYVWQLICVYCSNSFNNTKLKFTYNLLLVQKYFQIYTCGI